MADIILHQFDERRLLALPGDEKNTLDFAVEDLIQTANEAINDHDFFSIALSGGSTPKKIYQRLTQPKNKNRIDWKKTYLFWSDERSVPPDNKDSNYHMAMTEGDLSTLDIPPQNIFRMVAENDIEKNALHYEKKIEEILGVLPFDLVMLGVGEDGHTASLFPHTKALKEETRKVLANYVPQKDTWRMTFTYPLINKSQKICFYLFGSGKSAILNQVLTSPYNPEELPSQKVGTSSHPALWIIDKEASQELLSKIKL